MSIGFPKKKDLPKQVTAEEFRQAWKETYGRKNKFNNKRTPADQLCPFNTDSGLEREYYIQELAPLEMANKIMNIRREPKVEFDVYGEIFNYKPDWSYYDKCLALTIYVECKGDATDRGSTWQKNKKLWRACGPGPLHIVKGDKNRWKTVQIIHPRQRP